MDKTPVSTKQQLNRLHERVNHCVDTVTNGVVLMAVHETDALRGHWSEINERIAVARHARSGGELLREQLDLFPESRMRLARDQQVRVELLRGLIKDLSASENTRSDS